MDVNVPQAFLCHASEDKDLLVRPFGRELASLGVRPWMDEWEMFAGDSLVSKLESGLKESELFLPFLTPTSVLKPWVRLEIEAAVVRRLMDKVRIIPLVVGLSKEDIPPFLATIIWIGVDGPDGIPAAAEKAARAIFRVSDKPLVAPRPAYLSYAGPGVYGLSGWDILVLKAAGEEMMETGQRDLSTDAVFERLSSTEMPKTTFRESIDILDEKRHVIRQGVLGDQYKNLEVTVGGFELFSKGSSPTTRNTRRKSPIAISSARTTEIQTRGWYPAGRGLNAEDEHPETVAIQVFRNLRTSRPRRSSEEPRRLRGSHQRLSGVQEEEMLAKRVMSAPRRSASQIPFDRRDRGAEASTLPGAAVLGSWTAPAPSVRGRTEGSWS